VSRGAIASALALAAAALPAFGCGDEDSPTLVVSAASSLKKAFTQYGDGFDPADVKGSFAGSDELAGQIRAGARPDVFAAANTKLPDALFAEKRVERPVPFATNRLVIAVPEGSTKVGSLGDLAKNAVTISIGAEGVPIGDYTRRVLGGLPTAEAKAILANVRSNDPDVASIAGRVAQGGADAGFVYVTDVRASGGKLRAIEIPDELEPTVVYAVAVVRGAKHPDEAKDFIDGLLGGAGRRALLDAGFGPPPSA